MCCFKKLNVLLKLMVLILLSLYVISTAKVKVILLFIDSVVSHYLQDYNPSFLFTYTKVFLHQVLKIMKSLQSGNV